ADRNRGDVVDRLVGVELRALAAGLAQRIHDLGFEPQKAQLEDLEQAAGARAHDDDVGADQCALSCNKARTLHAAARPRSGPPLRRPWADSRHRRSAPRPTEHATADHRRSAPRARPNAGTYAERRHVRTSASFTHGTLSNRAEPWPGESLSAACEAKA